MKQIKTFEAKISVGLREKYSNVTHDICEVYDICLNYCNKVGLCVTVAPTKFIYMNGFEDGCFVGLINYPRFPSTNAEIKKHAMNIARTLLEKLNQNRISIICSDETYMIQQENV